MNKLNLPFLETPISLSDIKKLYSYGSFKFFLIELLKCDKIYNLRKNKSDSDNNLVLDEEVINYLDKFDNNNYNNNNDFKNIFKSEIQQKFSLKNIAEQKFNNIAEEIFKSKKEFYFDQYTYSLLRHNDENLISELYYQIQSNESSINELSRKYSQGAEKSRLGVIGPVNLSNIHNKIATILINCDIGVVNEPIKIDDLWFVIQKESYKSAIFNDEYKSQICNQLLQKELEIEFNQFLKIHNINFS